MSPVALAASPPGFAALPISPVPSEVQNNGSSVGPSPAASTSSRAQESKHEVSQVARKALSIPVVRLDSRTISDEMAATLSVSLLGHVLFLKSQIPFPVQQLARMPAGDSSNKKATKKRTEFADAFDELSSHLHTTFTALSTAFARNTARYPLPQPESIHDAPLIEPTSTAHLMIALGPTVGTVKARVILTIGGLEVKIWGTREAVQPSASPEEVGEESFIEDDDDEEVDGEDSTDESESDEESESEQSVSEESGSEEEEQDEDSEDEAQDDSDEEQTFDPGEDDLPEVPPDSHPPSEPHDSRIPSPLRDATNTSRVAPQHPPHPRASPPAHTIPSSLQNSASSAPTPSKPHLAPPQTKSYAEQQQIWRSATNLMSRQLVNACAEGDGMACEMAPTQTHILLRAPRRFSHPAWQPRQNLTSTLDKALVDFQRESGMDPAGDAGAAKRKRTGIKTEGVLVECTGRDQGEPAFEANEVLGSEDDEMIWWAWNGRLSGFSEW